MNTSQLKQDQFQSQIENQNYHPDILGQGYEQLTLNFPDDDEGKVVATLVRKKAKQNTRKAALYIHGFIDYFFQTEMADQFNQHGYDFYALDLRKYGRSYRPHQRLFYVENLKEYDSEISAALDIIQTENHDSVVLCGHSTGGLITTLYAAHHPQHPLIKALWLNSPFYDFNMSVIKRKTILPQLSKFGGKFPKLKFPAGLSTCYVESIHKSLQGEWDFRLDWKPQQYSKVYLGFIHAIFEAHKEIHPGAKLNIPTLVMHSDRSTSPHKVNKNARSSDVILNVKHIKKHAKKLQGDVNVMTIKQGLHDLVLSKTEVRQKVYKNLFKWLNQKN